MIKRLCVDNIPEDFRHLLPLAQKYGISDDVYRSDLVESISDEEKAELKEFLETYDDKLDVWLAGIEAAGPDFSEEYIAFSALRMAADEA